MGRAMANKATPLVQRMLGEATMKYAYREFQQAATLLLEVVRLAPGLPHAYQTLGLIYEESGQPVKALKLFMMAAHLSKRDVEAWKSLAALCRRYGEREQCVYCLQHVLALLPTDTGVQWERAQLLSELGEHRKAAKALLTLLRHQPGNANLVRTLVRCYHRLGYTSKAIELLDRLVASAKPPDAANTANADTSDSASAIGASATDSAAALPADATDADSALSTEPAAADSGGDGCCSGSGGGTSSSSTVCVDFHSLNMLLELLIEVGKFPQAMARIEQCRRLTLGNASRGRDQISGEGGGGEGDGGEGGAGEGGAGEGAGGGIGDGDGDCGSEHGGSRVGEKADGPSWSFPLEIQVKEGVCHAHLGNLPAAEACWRQLLSRSGRADECADLLYEVAQCYFELRMWQPALRYLRELTGNALYVDVVDIRIGECLVALGSAAESAESTEFFARAFERDPLSLRATLSIANVLTRHHEPRRAIGFVHRHLQATRAAARQDRRIALADRSATRGDVPRAEEELLSMDVDVAVGDAGAAVEAADVDLGEEGGAPEPTERLDVRLAVVGGLAHAAAGEHAQVARLLLPVERALGHAFTLNVRRPRGVAEGEDGHEGDPTKADGGRPAKRRRLRTSESGGWSDGEDEGASEDDNARASERAEAFEDLLGAPRRVRAAVALACSLTALGRHSLACAISVRLLEDMRTCTPERAEFYTAIPNEEIARLRLTCVRAAHACGEWDVAHSQLRLLCLAHPGFELNWALFNAVAGRARARGYDERWLQRLLQREPSSPQIAVGVAHHCFLSRSFKMAFGEYTRLHERYPSEPLLLLCVAISLMQLVMSRANKERGHSVLLAFGWLEEYAKIADQQEATYNTARAYHHLGLSSLAVAAYEKALALADTAAAPPPHETDSSRAARDLSRESLHNLSRIFCASGNRDLARSVIRSMPVV